MENKKHIKSLNEATEGLNISEASYSYGMGKNILDKNCGYYGEEMFFKVFNKLEDWSISYSRVYCSTNILFKKGTNISLYEKISSNYTSWEHYLSDGTRDYNEKNILTQSQFLVFLKDAFK